jgi:hypothetical protein
VSLGASVLLLAAGASAAATSHTVTATAGSGGTSATFTYSHITSGTAMPYSNAHLSITRNGQRLLDAPVNAILCRTECWPALGTGTPALSVLDIEHDGSPDVILNLYSGGAHCCYITQIYRYDPGTQTYAVVQQDFGDPGVRLEKLSGSLVFRSADDRFAYTFAAFAFSGLPLQIWSFATGRFVDVTRRYPSLIAADAAEWWKAYVSNRKQGFGLGFVAAWAADEDLLGRSAMVATELAKLNAAGELRSSQGFTTQGSAFIKQLQAFLVKSGYVR